MNVIIERVEVSEETTPEDKWDEKSNAFNNIVFLLESYGIKDNKLINVLELIKDYEKKLIAWHCLE